MEMHWPKAVRTLTIVCLKYLWRFCCLLRLSLCFSIIV